MFSFLFCSAVAGMVGALPSSGRWLRWLRWLQMTIWAKMQPVVSKAGLGCSLISDDMGGSHMIDFTIKTPLACKHLDCRLLGNSRPGGQFIVDKQ